MGDTEAALDEWVDGIRRRSDDAFRAVYGLTANDLTSFAAGLLRDRRAAEDAVQQAFLELSANAHRFGGDGRALRAWLFRSVRYRCLDELRRRRRRPETPTADLPDVVTDLEPDHLPEVHAALAALSVRQRSIVVLRHVIGLSGEEVARIMRMSRPAVYAALTRAERRLRRELDAQAAGASSREIT